MTFGIFLGISYFHAPGSCEHVWQFPVVVELPASMNISGKPKH